MRQIELIHKDKIKPYKNNPRNNTQDSGDTRQETLFNNGLLTQGGLSNVSLIDEVLCEIIVTWFGKKGGLVFDTFAGSRFGIVATELGMEFKGIELRKEQAELNQARAEALRTANKFTATRKIGKHHQNILIFTKGEILETHSKILVFLKGDAREATKATDLCDRDFEIEKIEYEQADIDSL